MIPISACYILTLNRFGNGTDMDALSYSYTPLTNKLSHVDDTKGIALYTTDIDDQNPLNYTYDAIGNLTSDVYQTNSDFEIFDGFFFLASSLKFLAIGKAMAKNFALMQEKII